MVLVSEKFTKIPIAEIIKIPNDGETVQLYKNRWWAVTEDDCILLFKEHSYQCNTNINIMERVLQSKTHPGVKVQFIETAYIPCEVTNCG